MRNSFKDLEKLKLEDVKYDSDRVKNAIDSDMGFIRYITSIVEMYFPRVIDLFITLSGGTPNSPDQNNIKKSKYPDLNN